jgi:hypothetical protein
MKRRTNKMKIEIIGTGMGPILSSKKLDELFFGTSTINKKNPLEEAMDKLLDEARRGEAKTVVLDSLGDVMERVEKDVTGKYSGKPICFDIQAITANHKKNAFTVVWGDGSHTIIHLQKGDVWDDEKALAMCFVKHMMGDTGSFNDIFTTEMPAKIKHIGKVEPAEEKHECHCATPCEKCTCGETKATGGNIGGFNIVKTSIEKEAEKAAEASVNAALNKMGNAAKSASTAMKELINELTCEPTKIKRYDLFLMDPCGDKTEIYHQGTDEEIHKAMRAYRMKHYPTLEANRTPYRVWMIKGNLMIDFGAGSYFMVPGMDHDTFVKR